MPDNVRIVSAVLHLREASDDLKLVDLKTSVFLLQLAKAVLADAKIPDAEVDAAAALETSLAGDSEPETSAIGSESNA